MQVKINSTNSGFKVREGALLNMTIERLQALGGEDGLIIEVNGDLSDVEKIQPNTVLTELNRFLYKFMAEEQNPYMKTKQYLRKTLVNCFV